MLVNASISLFQNTLDVHTFDRNEWMSIFENVSSNFTSRVVFERRHRTAKVDQQYWKAVFKLQELHYHTRCKWRRIRCMYRWSFCTKITSSVAIWHVRRRIDFENVEALCTWDASIESIGSSIVISTETKHAGGICLHAVLFATCIFSSRSR